jgi:hypothetical protein
VSERPLRQDARVDEPGLVGARWWQDSVVDPVGRRQAILTLLVAGGLIGVAGVGAGAAVEACEPTKTSRLLALELQRKYGWSFGAATESLVFNGVSTEPFDPGRLAAMVTDLGPRVASHRPFYVPTLFESPTALPQAVSEADPTPIPPLSSALKPILTSSMRHAYQSAQGALQALAAVPGAALVVDLDGQDSVAFAAGASSLFDPVFLFDNWPHPHGVVPAHLTLAAAAYYQPMLANAARSGPRDSPAMFVLDRQRLNSYTDSAERFDNRWVARMPGVQALKALGVRRLLYVEPSSSGRELDDLNDDFVTDHAAGIAITLVDLTAIDAASVASTAKLAADYTPIARRTQFSSGVAGGGRPTPSEFGSVPVVLGLAGGALLGVAWSRSGTWNRGGGGFWHHGWGG